MSESDYSAKDIVVLSGPQGVRKRPAMYIGSTASPGYLHLLNEVLDNAIDEALGGYANSITVRLTREDDMDAAEISDNGRGIPVDVIPKVGKHALEVIMTSLHSGAKFDNKVYKVSGGLHGVGLTVVNSLSEYTEVTVRKNGKIYRQRFSRGAVMSPLEEIGPAEGNSTGTTIKFKPDKEIFSAKSFDTIHLTERLKDLAFLNPGIRITLIDEREDPKTDTQFYSKDGLPEFLAYLLGKNEALTKPITIKKESGEMRLELVMQYANSYSETLLSFINKIKTAEGGTHVTGFHTALTRAITTYNQKSGKKKGMPIEGDDTREGLIVILSMLLQDPEF